MEFIQQRLGNKQEMEGEYLTYLISHTEMIIEDVYGSITELLLAGVDTVHLIPFQFYFRFLFPPILTKEKVVMAVLCVYVCVSLSAMSLALMKNDSSTLISQNIKTTDSVWMTWEIIKSEIKESQPVAHCSEQIIPSPH